MTSWIVRSVRDDDWSAIADLRSKIFGGTVGANRRYLDWKYRHNPYQGPPLMVVATVGHTIVGMRGWFVTPWSVGVEDGRLLVPSASELAIHPDHRNRGIHSALDEASIELAARAGFPFVVNVSATPANYLTSVMQLGWRRVGGYRTMVRTPPVRATTRWRRDAQRVVRRARRMIGHADDRLRPDRSQLAGATWSDRPDPAELGAISAGDARSRGVMTPVRDSAYYRWRLSNPLSRYHVLAAEASGFVLLQHSTGQPVTLLDWAGPTATVCGLVATTVRCLPGRSIRSWSANLEDGLMGQLASLGFELDADEQRRGLLVKASAKPLEQLDPHVSELSSWTLRPVISDRY